MQLQPKALSYVPTLCTRPSEVRGLEKLPGPTKDRLQPLFLLAPWPNAGSLDLTMEKINGAFPGRAYALDIDQDYLPGADAGAISEFLELKDPSNAYENWCSFVAKSPNANPALQLKDMESRGILKQIERFQQLGRTYCLRIELSRFPVNIAAVVSALNQVGSADFFVVIEGGWQPDVLLLAGKVSGLVESELSAISADVRIVVSATSIRTAFTDVEGTKTDAFNNRQLLAALARKHNSRQFVYGDWGSTRPRTYERASAPLPRVDYPLRDSWMFARNKSKGWGYEQSAKAVLNSPEWTDCFPLRIWGEEMIVGASKGAAMAVNSVQKNISARVNIHLHKQAFYDQHDLRLLDLDEPWEDM